jgi:hypothetical protein
VVGKALSAGIPARGDYRPLTYGVFWICGTKEGGGWSFRDCMNRGGWLSEKVAVNEGFEFSLRCSCLAVAEF